LHSFFNHNTFLILGGYTVSACFSRCDVEMRIASAMQGTFEKRPKLFLLAMMLLGLFLSMWISNHTAPVLCISVISPIISDFGSDSRFVKALLLGVAFACNFGGMMTPISSLQNIIAIEQMNSAGFPMSFGEWIVLSTPIALVGTLVAWLLIVAIMKPNDVKTIPKIIYEEKPFGFKAYSVCILSGLTILAWACSGTSKLVFGDLGIIR
jgi:phosphate transporter